jgi:hypothetical protein
MGRERMAERMTARGLRDARRPNGSANCTLENGLTEVVPASLPGLGIAIDPGCRKDPLPDPFPPRVWEFPLERRRQLDRVAIAADADRFMSDARAALAPWWRMGWSSAGRRASTGVATRRPRGLESITSRSGGRRGSTRNPFTRGPTSPGPIDRPTWAGSFAPRRGMSCVE